MTGYRFAIVGAAAALLTLASLVTLGSSNAMIAGEDDGMPVFGENDSLSLPDTSSWSFVSASAVLSGGADMMAAGEQDEAAEESPGDFHIISMNPSSFAAYQETGAFPEGTVFVTTFYSTTDNGIPANGRAWADGINKIEVGVKDSTRFADGWGFYLFNGSATSAALMPSDKCFACHEARAATDRVFTQLYTTMK